jgi:hypothetical protein
MQKNYQYTYFIQIVELIGSEEVMTHIANYSSNAVPPQIGSTIDPGEFAKEGYKAYKVIDLEIIPHAFDDLHAASDITHVNVFVEKIKKS